MDHARQGVLDVVAHVEEEGSTSHAKDTGATGAAGARARPLLRAVFGTFRVEARGDLQFCLDHVERA